MIVLPSLSGSAARVADLPREGFKYLVLDVTGTPFDASTITVHVEVKDEVSGKWAPIWTSTTLAATAFASGTPTDRTTAFFFGYGGNANGVWANGVGPVGAITPAPVSGVATRVRVVTSAGTWQYSLCAFA